MARIAGIDLPRNKRGVIGLTYIYGIGSSTAAEILDACKKENVAEPKMAISYDSRKYSFEFAKEVAAVMGVSARTVNNHLVRAVVPLVF